MNKTENSKLLLINSTGSMFVKIGSIIIALFTTPAYLQYFDNSDILGAWFTILSVLAWMLNCDMGIGNGLRNSLVYALNKKDNDKIRELISSAYIFLFAVSFIIMLLLYFVSGFANWNRVFNISPNIIPTSIFNKALLILILSILLQLVLRLVTSIFYALQKAFIPGLLSLLTNFLMLIIVVACNVSNNNNDIVMLALFYLLAVNLPLIISTFFVFKNELNDCYPSFKYFSFDSAFSVLSTGTKFLWLQLVALIMDNTNSYLISSFIGNSAVVDYQIYYKIFSLPGTITILFSSSIWSIITKAKAEKNYIWLRKAYYVFMLSCFAVAVCEFLMIPFLQIIFNLWLGPNVIAVNSKYAIVFAISGSVMAYRTFLCTFSNGMFSLKNQTIWMTVGAIMNIPIAFYLSKATNSMTSVLIANIICMIPYCIADTIYFCKVFKKKQLQ